MKDIEASDGRPDITVFPDGEALSDLSAAKRKIQSMTQACRAITANVVPIDPTIDLDRGSETFPDELMSRDPRYQLVICHPVQQLTIPASGAPTAAVGIGQTSHNLSFDVSQLSPSIKTAVELIQQSMSEIEKKAFHLLQTQDVENPDQPLIARIGEKLYKARAIAESAIATLLQLELFDEVPPSHKVDSYRNKVLVSLQNIELHLGDRVA